MPDAIYPNLFRLKIPLPGSPLKYLNAYLIKGERRSLLVDTGKKQPECRIAMLDALDQLDVDLKNVDFFITHFHEDHVGQLAGLIKGPCTVYLNHADLIHLEALKSLEPLIRAAIQNGYPEAQIRSALDPDDGVSDLDKWRPYVRFMADNDPLTIGDYHFTCMHTPGHTPGHLCLYEKEKGILISGDHVLGDISPNITCWFDGSDPLKEYLKSLEPLRGLNGVHVLPGHREPFHDLGRRVDELRHHHELRLEEILRILNQDRIPRTAYEVASKMHWDIEAESWDAFPTMLKYFATGEANTHLRYLQNQKAIQCDAGQVRRYSVSADGGQ